MRAALRNWPRSAVPPYNLKKLAGQSAAMEAYKWFMLGMIIAWMPGLLVLALMLWRDQIDDSGQDADTALSRH